MTLVFDKSKVGRLESQPIDESAQDEGVSTEMVGTASWVFGLAMLMLLPPREPRSTPRSRPRTEEGVPGSARGVWFAEDDDEVDPGVACTGTGIGAGAGADLVYPWSSDWDRASGTASASDGDSSTSERDDARRLLDPEPVLRALALVLDSGLFSMDAFLCSRGR
jgi:hypothetical protein